MPALPFIPESHEAEGIERFIELTEDLNTDSLTQLDLDALPERDRTYVWRMRILLQVDPSLLQRQRVTWVKLRHEIPLLESEARELLEVLGCRGFYDVSLVLKGMTLQNLDLRGAVIGGDYDCRYTTVQGECDETALFVRGTATLTARRISGKLRGPWALDERNDSEAPRDDSEQLELPEIRSLAQSYARLVDLTHPSLAAPHAPTRISDDALASFSGLVELGDDDLVIEDGPPTERPAERRTNHRPPSRLPRRASQSLRRTSRPPELASSTVDSSAKVLPAGSAPLRYSDRGELLPSLTPLQVDVPLARNSKSADTREIDAAW